MNLNRRIPLRDPEPDISKPDALCVIAWVLVLGAVVLLANQIKHTPCSNSSATSSAPVASR